MERMPAGIKAVFFDMDGTLIDSEPLTDLAVQAILDVDGLQPPSFALGSLHGKTWQQVEAELHAEYPVLAGKPLVARLQADFDRRMRAQMPLPVRGAVGAFRAASRRWVTGIVSSSPRATIEFVVDTLGLSGACRVLVGAEHIRRSKPDPECYLLAATRARARPQECLVFEDSEAGLTAARNAGMTALAVVGNREAADVASLGGLSDLVIRDYTALPPGFFSLARSAS